MSSMRGTTLCLKNTFIDVHEELEHDDASPLRYARSDPGDCWAPSSAFFQEDEDYVDELRARMIEMWSLGKKGAATTCDTLPPLSEALEEIASCASSVLAKQDMDEDADEDSVESRSVSAGSEPSPYEAIEGFGEEIQPPPAPWKPQCPPGCNPGSVGHPNLCKRPCRFFLEGMCQGGTDCDFCHLPHPKKGGSLDKKSRVLIKSMTPNSRCGLLATVMRNKAQPFPRICDLIDRWAAEMGVDAAAVGLDQWTGRGVKMCALRRLVSSMETMTLANICSVARAYVDSTEVADFCDHLLATLREEAVSGVLPGDL